MQTKKNYVLTFLMFLFFAFFSIQAVKTTVKLSASPLKILSGNNSTLTWSSSNATSAYINQGIGSVPLNGSLSVSPTQTTIYTITVRNSSGYRRASAKVTVTPALPTVTFTAAPDSIILGQSSTLSWTAGNASTVSINQGIGTVTLNGTRAITPSATTTYIITVTGSGGTVTAAATVTVNAGLPEITFSASPTTIQSGQGSTLNWTTVSATSVTIEPGICATELNGSAMVFPAQTTIYTLTATGPGGTSSSQVEVQVQELAPTVSLTVNPTSIQSGETATLSWTSNNADSALLDNGIGAVELNGSLPVAPTATTTYAISVTGPGGTQTAAVTLTVFSGIKYYAYISDAADKKLRIVDTDTGLMLKTIDVIGTSTSLQGVAAEPSGVFTYVADAGTTRIIKIDPLTMTNIGELPLTGSFQGSPRHLALAPDGCFLYTTSSVPMWNPDQGKYVGAICTIKTSGNTMSAVRGVNVELPSRISLEGLAVSLDNTRLFVTDPDSSRILVLDTAKLQRWAANMVPISDELIAAIPLDSPPMNVVVSPDGQTLYAFADSILFEIDAQNLTVSRSLVVPPGSRFMKVHPDGSNVYVATCNTLSIVETAGLTKTATISITGLYSCSGLDIHPDGSRIFLVDKTIDKLITVSTSNYQVMFTTSIGPDPTVYGKFLGHLPLTISGTVTQDERGLNGVTMTLDGEGVLRTRQTAAAGEFLFGLKPGNYQLTPTMSNQAFVPENMNLHVTGSQTGLDFSVSGVVPPPTVTLSSSSTWVNQYESFTLTWDSTGADYVKLEMVTSDHLPPSGSRTFALPSTSTIWAVAYNRGGSASASVKVYVYNTDPPTATISSTPTSILQGCSATLNWSTTKATTVTIDNGIGTVAVNGSKVVSPTVTTTYTLTVLHSSGYQVIASTTITVSEFDTSAKLTGTVTDSATSQPIPDVMVNALDVSGVPQTALTDVNGKYEIANLRIGDVTVSFAKTGYDPYQQTIIIPSNTTFDMTTQLHQTQIGATLTGVVKDGQSNQPIVGAMITAAYSNFSQTSISVADGSYILTNIPLGVSATITASYTGYQSKTIQQNFTQAQNYIWDFVLYNSSTYAIINGKITNAKTLQPEEGVAITYKGTNATTISDFNGEFTFKNISLGEQSFFVQKNNFINKIYKLNIDKSTYQWDIVEPNVVGVPYPAFVKPNVVGTVFDVMSGRTIPNAIIKIPGLNINIVADQSGNYAFNELPDGNYPFLVMALDHKATSYNLAISSIGKDRFDFYVPSTTNGSIFGVVSDAQTGETINSATIEIEGSAVLVANSNSEGNYKIIQIPSGSYVVKVNHGEYEVASFPDISVSDNQSTNLNVTLTKKPIVGNMQGTLKDRQSGNLISGAILTIEGTSLTATTDNNGFYQMENIPAGLNKIIINATSYPEETRTVGILANPYFSAPEINIYNIQLDSSNPTPEYEVSITINASEGGEIAAEDDRFILTIPPNSLSADAVITLKFPLDGPSTPPGSDLSIDPEFGLNGIKSIGKMIQLEIAPVVAGDPIPSIKGGVLVSGMYSQNEAEIYGLDEKTISPYYYNGISWGILRTIPNELIVDNVNNLVVASLNLSETENGNIVNDPGKYIFVFGGYAHSKSGSQKLSNLQVDENPNTNIKIIDKEKLSAVMQFSESSPQYPNPNALPILFFHGWQFKATALNCTADPNDQNERYYWMINDVVKFTNGVYRPVFISYNPRARIESLGNDIAQKIFPGLHEEIFTGIPATNSDNPDNGFFPFFDAIGYSMGGIVARSFNSRGGKINNIEMIATPNHGTLSFIKYVKYLGLLKHKAFKVIASLYSFLKFHSPGSFDLLGYDDSDSPAGSFNPSLATLNINPNTIPWGDMTLLAGTDHSKLIGFLLDGENDSLVPVGSVFCRTSDSIDGERESLLKVFPGKHKWEREAGFNHFNVCSTEAGYRMVNFQDFLRKGLSDWTVSLSDGGSENNYFTPPTETTSGSFKTQVLVDYNVFFDPENSDSERHTPRDIDRVVLVSYATYMDGDETKYYIVGNNADEQGNVLISEPVQKYSGIGGNVQIHLSDYSQFPQIDPNNPKTWIIRVFPVICNLSPGVNTVPLTPQNVTFTVPDTK